jgi:hypothetical protein
VTSIENPPPNIAALSAVLLFRRPPRLRPGHLRGLRAEPRQREVVIRCPSRQLQPGGLFLCSRRFDDYPTPAAPGLLADNDPDVSMQRREEAHQAFDGEVVEPSAVDQRHLRLVDAISHIVIPYLGC